MPDVQVCHRKFARQSPPRLICRLEPAAMPRVVLIKVEQPEAREDIQLHRPPGEEETEGDQGEEEE